ncbi:hypothetical protein KXD40_002466 [Peronospora effusa]|nr:hypothetical protein KXD40_002466 [Peronospora effusa]
MPLRNMLFSHDCENRVIHRKRPDLPDSCEWCCSIWLHDKSFKRILKKMNRYTRRGYPETFVEVLIICQPDSAVHLK